MRWMAAFVVAYAVATGAFGAEAWLGAGWTGLWAVVGTSAVIAAVMLIPAAIMSAVS